MSVTLHRPNRPAGPRLAISLWDFSWYTQAGPGEPFENLDEAFDQLLDRGFNAVRICALPFLLFSGRVPDTDLTVCGLGHDYGQRTRWYNVRGGYPLRPLDRLEQLFDSAGRHGVRVIVSSWEYQQSPCFVTSDVWFRALAAVPPADRCQLMAQSLARLVEHLSARGLAGPIAYLELHNEVDNCGVCPPTPGDPPGHYARLRVPLRQGLATLRQARPDLLSTYSIGETWPIELTELADEVGVAHFHFYVYGVLAALYQAVGLGHGTGARPAVEHWPTPTLAGMLRPDAPRRADYRPDASWQTRATGIDGDLFYVHDWVDPDRWDLWLYEHYQEHRLAMRAALTDWVAAVAAHAGRLGVPAVLGEGVVGYTPRLSRFEEDAVGKDLAEHTVRGCLDHGYWGAVLTSNAAPQHPMWWTDQSWMRRLNAQITGAAW
ncbi:cellulase-like family protein [Rugosimonospora africana]|uniref:Sugar-binding cellulase-like n=1 Tax=Rugosimonospora africana TaxID=556532 RepID=A0A8J3QPM6_9ACTN|nr:cellulase-like family protein [Rugosimonospora africana]GIH15150.1 hypothetical protein Raf01_33220 [Rugosimonospora africana]